MLVQKSMKSNTSSVCLQKFIRNSKQEFEFETLLKYLCIFATTRFENSFNFLLYCKAWLYPAGWLAWLKAK